MKKLMLVFVVLCVGYVVQGQIKVELGTLAEPTFSGGYYLNSNPNLVQAYKEADERFLLEILLDYQQYCYNDSIKSEFYDIVIDTVKLKEWREDGIKGIPIKEVVYEYHHLNPTFEGFIEWLKDKRE